MPVGVDHFASNEYWLGFHKSTNVSQDIRVTVCFVKITFNFSYQLNKATESFD